MVLNSNSQQQQLKCSQTQISNATYSEPERDKIQQVTQNLPFYIANTSGIWRLISKNKTMKRGVFEQLRKDQEQQAGAQPIVEERIVSDQESARSHHQFCKLEMNQQNDIVIKKWWKLSQRILRELILKDKQEILI
ncbi:unnamed protein product [Paramecium octaurelia]|uniref:Uncharacterized protein n=1 Tax=Paramecium octaurelia TaxID=43137 RepID=A0A8S1YPM7_PAROT|nr:unnamed protein product [Paramecium octaurelia]CAD8214779.1 unnamed protein product [Paramecium octaurelia]